MKRLDEAAMRPLTYSSKSFYAFVGVLGVVLVWFLYAWWTQLSEGLSVTGMNVRVAWGLYISNFVFFVGISAAGIAIAAAIRVLKLKTYQPIARMAELLTVVSLALAMLFVIFDLGRPDRMLNLLVFGRPLSPLMWDFTVIGGYLIVSVAYLYLSMRPDLTKLAEESPSRNRFYRLLALGYTEAGRARLQRILFWMSILILPFIVVAHSVVGFLFGLMSAQPGWYSTATAPYFVAAAITSGIGAVILVASLTRKLFGWEDYLKPELFRGLGNFLRVLIPIYLYFMIAETLTALYQGPELEHAVFNSLLFGEFAWLNHQNRPEIKQWLAQTRLFKPDPSEMAMDAGYGKY